LNSTECVPESQREIELCGTGPVVRIEERQLQLERTQLGHRIVLEDEHDLKQRRTAGIPPLAEGGDENFQRYFLVFQSLY
jgi:hypothetical protein